jgi:hypothetical protein
MSSSACGSCGAPTGDGAYLCDGPKSCTRDLAELLQSADDIGPALDDAHAWLLTHGDGHPRGGQPDIRPDDLAAAAELNTVLTGWTAALLLPGEEWPHATAPLARWLLARLGRVRQNRQTPSLYRRFRAAMDRALEVIDTAPERAPAGLCDNCGQQLLAELGADSVTCGCGMTVLALQDKRRQRAAAADVLGTPAELSAVLATLGYRVAPGTISAWGTLGRIERRAGGMYRLSEALAMAARAGTRRARVGG